MQTWAIIYNPTSGRHSPSKLEAVQELLHGHEVRAALHPTTYAGHATEIARTVTGVERVLSYGGDGTLNEVAGGLLGRDIPLMFVPGGTANAMAYELGIPRDPVKAVTALLQGEPRPIRPGQVGGRVFMLMVGFGFDATIVKLVSVGVKAKLGAMAYVVNGFRALLHPKPEILVETPLGTLRGVWVVGARARRYGGMFYVHPRAALTRPDLGVVVVNKAMIAPFAFTNLIFGTRFTNGGIRLEDHSAFRISCEEPVAAQVDGEYLGEGTSFAVGISQQTLLFCLPVRK
ncbi:MAG: YegS/Rv2252/BmrU family lipid kinase [SAR324 cluster bacterium]|nr:YegS/Rv2252/BmrU family lipid kinase [SAR324 cluster bacterium]